MEGNGKFPFHYIKFKEIDAETGEIIQEIPFIQQVKYVLQNNIQEPNVFGCKIKNCHTHAGSKIHFSNFIEAELLFHNSYYNHHFAQLTLQSIRKLLNKEEYKGVSEIALIGYENYSELYLQELNRLLGEELRKKNKRCRYCVYETISECKPDGSRVNKASIREEKGEKSTEKETLHIFIVSINTSLSTMDKMMAEYLENFESDLKEKFLYECFCLITLGRRDKSNEDKKYEYWEYYRDKNGFPKGRLRPEKGRFQHIKKDVINFVLFESDWRNSKQCNNCFPDQAKGEEKKSILCEMPMFGVNRGSVVPMLKIGKSDYLNPIDPIESKIYKENLRRIWRLSNCLSYSHVLRGENHFQYYFDTEKFLAENKGDLKRFLCSLKDRIVSKNDETIFDFIVAPRHRTNAGWVHLVNECVFDGTARIMYFDVDKEYRSNIKAKYSDLANALENIQSSEQEFKIRFHFVDDTIHSGTNYLRAKNLVTSLTAGITEKERLFLFDSVILLINRLSPDTKRFYMGTGKYISYVDVNISPMRRHDDACTLCKLIYDYHIIKNESATNEMADICQKVIENHKGKDASILDDCKEMTTSVWNEIEKRFIFLISHLLNERISNRFALHLNKEPSEPINSEEGYEEIENILKIYYRSMKKIFKNYIDESDIEDKELVWKIAFIKAISRPFFIYHIRQRQAAFSFCLEELDTKLFPNTGKKMTRSEKKRNNVLVKTLVKALSDMNANYIIRREIFEHLIEFAKDGDNQYYEIDAQKGMDEINLYINKNIFTSQSLVHYMKKTVTLSRDFTKSLLLEYILLFNSETPFFEGVGRNVEKLTGTRFPMVEHFLENGEFSNSRLSVYGKLYLENNVIFKDMLGKKKNLDKIIAHMETGNRELVNELYFISNFIEIWNLNLRNEAICSIDILNAYKKLKEKINGFAESSERERKDFSNELNEFFDRISEKGTGKVSTLRGLFFVQDQKEAKGNTETVMEHNKEQAILARKCAPLFRFFTLAGDPAISDTYLECRYENLSTSQAFFYDGNIAELNKGVDENLSSSIFFIHDELGRDENAETLIVRFGDAVNYNEIQVDCNEESEASIITDQSIYVQIWGFDKCSLEHWFALKLLLTLREDIVDLIKRINLNQLVESRKVAMQKAALSISKASTHSQAEKYFAELLITQGISSNECGSDEEKEAEIYSQILSVITSKIGDPDVQVNGYDMKEAIKDALHTWSQHDIYDIIMQIPIQDLSYRWIMYDKYYQLLADEFISSLYRKRIKNEEFFSNCKFKMDLRKSLVHILGMRDETVMIITRVNGRLVQCQINLKLEENCEIVNRYMSESGIDIYVFIILLVAMNVCEHEKSPSLNVYISSKKIVFENVVSDIFKALNGKKYWYIPPWLFPKNDQHTSLWTLGHLYRDSGPWVDARFEIDEINKKFITEFVFKGGKR